MPAIDFEQTLLEQCEAIWAATRFNEQRELNLRKVPPLVQLWDGEMRLQHVVQAEYSFGLELPENDTGYLELRHPFDHPVGEWLYDQKGRLDRGEKRNVNITVEYCGSRIGGLIDTIDLDLEDNGVQIVVARFASDYERLKWYSVWSNPWLPEWIQWPQIFLLPGPITWILSLTLHFQIMREMSSAWALPSDPMASPQTGLNQATWSMVVKPISFMDALNSGVLWGIVISRFQNFHEIAKSIMEDGEITCRIRPWLEGDPPPWDGAPTLRHGTRVVEFVDNSGTYTGTSQGGNIFDGLLRTFFDFADDIIDSTEHLVEDTAIPPEYYIPGSKRTQKELPFAIWRDGEISGLERYRYRQTPSKGIQVVTGGHSMPGVNEAISAAIQMAGDLIAIMIGVPPIGGAADAILAPLYCVSGDTIIEGPDGDERIDVLAEHGNPFRVWSITPFGERIAATARFAFRKGTTELFEYTLANGRTLTATKHHRWLTPGGWLEAGYTSVGTHIATANHARLHGHAHVDTPAFDLPDSAWSGVPAGEAVEYSPLISVRSVGIADFYDMSVPGWVNYSGNGIWSHNTDALLAWMVARSGARAENQGWTRYFEYFAGSARAYTLSSLIVLRAGFWATRAFDAAQFGAGDGLPYLVGEIGHVWLGDRAGFTIRGDRSGRIYIDRVSKIGLSWDRDTAPGWTITIGSDSAVKDPVQKAWERIEAIIQALQGLGVF